MLEYEDRDGKPRQNIPKWIFFFNSKVTRQAHSRAVRSIT